MIINSNINAQSVNSNSMTNSPRTDRLGFEYWNRANIAHKLVYGVDKPMPIFYTNNNTLEECELEIVNFFAESFTNENVNSLPVIQQFNCLEEVLNWFNERYPLKQPIALMNKGELIKEIAARTGSTEKKTAAVLDAIV